MTDLATNQVTAIKRAVLNEDDRNVDLTLGRTDGADILLKFSPEMLAELIGLAGMASEILDGGEPRAVSDEVVRVVGVSASPTVSGADILVRLEDTNGFFHDFEIDEKRCSSLRFKLRRSIDTVRKARVLEATERVESANDIPEKS